MDDCKIVEPFLIGKDYRGQQLKFKGDILKTNICNCSFNDDQIKEITKEWQSANRYYV